MIAIGSGVPGDLVTGPGMLQYGTALIPGWFDLLGWLDAPPVTLNDAPKPQAPGDYPGDVIPEGKTITYSYRLDLLAYGNDPAARLADLRTLLVLLTPDGIDRPLVVDDGLGPTMRMARVIARTVPQGWDFTWQRILDLQVQFRAADPRRYGLATSSSGAVALGTSTGGLAYPLAYPLAYGTTVGGSRNLTNAGGSATPPVVTFAGPLTNPLLTATTAGGSTLWRMGFNRGTGGQPFVLADTETLVVDVAAGSVLLNGTTDRLYTIDPTSTPLERCLLPPGQTTLSLAAAAGTGTATATARDAYL